MKYIIYGHLFLLIQLTYAQIKNTNDLEGFGRLNLGLHGLELSYELPVAKKWVWENAVGIGMGMDAINGASYTFYLDRPVPYLKSQLKWIYNRAKRKAKKKTLHNNSGNYLGLQTKYSFGNTNIFDLSQSMLTEVHWGIQTNLGQRFLFNTHIGLGYLYDFDFLQGTVSPTAAVRFGYRLF